MCLRPLLCLMCDSPLRIVSMRGPSEGVGSGTRREIFLG